MTPTGRLTGFEIHPPRRAGRLPARRRGPVVAAGRVMVALFERAAAWQVSYGSGATRDASRAPDLQEVLIMDSTSGTGVGRPAEVVAAGTARSSRGGRR